MINKLLFSSVQKLIPRVSASELIALRSGTSCMDREIFEGKVTYPPKELSKQDHKFKFDKNAIDELLKKYKNQQKIFPSSNTSDVIQFISSKKFFSFIIQEKYGGEELSVSELSSILTHISSNNPALGVIIMVPNSLGPGELLQNYGTVEQKQRYLPKLSSGELIPCFGLTGPNNGSDATGSLDEGKICINENNEKIIRVTINKRYITLSPIANLVGLAIKVKDPDSIIIPQTRTGEYDGSDENAYEGVTLALIEKGHPGLEQLTHHNPLNAGFPNGTIKGTIDIPINAVIGGESKIGHGWKMLMECLAAGRGICLPATAKASSNVCALAMMQYSKHRKQFKIPLAKMEGIQEKLIDIIYHTWVINTSIDLTNFYLDRGERPSVISAVMKQQTTERARKVLNSAMDIHSGSAICLGENNILGKFYQSAPIGITVEGSNTLTRSLIIFGQGLNKSHPYIFDVMESILNNNVQSFNKNFNDIMKHGIKLYFKACINKYHSSELEKQTIEFANLSNFVALKGGQLKSEQMISGDMADIFSNLYLAHSVKWHDDTFQINKKIANYCIERLLEENKEKFNRVIHNLSATKIFLCFFKKKLSCRNYALQKDILKEAIQSDSFYNMLSKDIDIKHNSIKDLLDLDKCEGKEYDDLYNKIIQVGEYNNPNKV
jgi:acyl-CoA dehydrogenase